MGKSAPTPPPPPDPVELARAQSDANQEAARQTALLNRLNEVSPYGASYFVRPGDPGDVLRSLPAYATSGAPANLARIAGVAPPESRTSPPMQQMQPAAPIDNSLAINNLMSRLTELDGLADESEAYDGELLRAREGLARLRAEHGTLPSAPAGGAPVAAPIANRSDAAPGMYYPTSVDAASSGASVDSPWTRITYLHPAEQENLERQRAISQDVLGLGRAQVNRIQDAIGTPIDFSALSGPPGSGGFGAERQRVEDLVYGQATRRLDPMFEQQRAAMEQRLANQGITVQSNPEAYGRAFDLHSQARNDAYGQALSRAAQTAAAEQSRLFALNMAARENALREQLTARNQPINELAALLGTSPAVAMPQFPSAAPVGVQPTDVTSPALAAYQAQANAANQAAANDAAFTQGLFGLGGSIFGGAAPWWIGTIGG